MCWSPCNCSKRIYFGQNGTSYKAKVPGAWNDIATSPWQLAGTVAIDLDAVNERFYFASTSFLKNCDLNGGDIQSSDMGYAGPTANCYAVRAYPSLSKIVYVRSDPAYAHAGQRAIVTADLDDTGGSRSTVYQDPVDGGHPVGATVHYWTTTNAICQDIDTGIIYFIRTSTSTAAGRPFSELCSVPSTGGGETVLYSTDSDANFAGTVNGQSIEIDYVNSQLWFVNQRRTVSSTHEDQIVKCNLDGTGYTVMFTASTGMSVLDIQVHHDQQRLYYLYNDPTDTAPYGWNDAVSGLRSAALNFTDDRLDYPLSKLYDDASQWGGAGATRMRLGEKLITFDEKA